MSSHSPNLSRVCQDFRRTETVWCVDLGTGHMTGIPLDQYAIMDSRAFDGYAVEMDEIKAAMVSARVLDAIAQRN